MYPSRILRPCYTFSLLIMQRVTIYLTLLIESYILYPNRIFWQKGGGALSPIRLYHNRLGTNGGQIPGRLLIIYIYSFIIYQMLYTHYGSLQGITGSSVNSPSSVYLSGLISSGFCLTASSPRLLIINIIYIYLYLYNINNQLHILQLSMTTMYS